MAGALRNLLLVLESDAEEHDGATRRAEDTSDFLSGSARREEKSRKKVSFDDVAGQENAKREVSELVDFLKSPDRYRNLGAEPPHGVLMMGPPGTGKTLLRSSPGRRGRCTPSSTSRHPSSSRCSWGVGASRVRHMFDEAKKRAPSIIFIDELDAVGPRARGGFWRRARRTRADPESNPVRDGRLRRT